MIHPDRITRTMVAFGLVVVIAATALAACGGGSHPSTMHVAESSHYVPRTRKPTPPPRTSLAFAALAYLFPRTATDITVSEQLAEFQASVTDRSIANCLSTDGFPAPRASSAAFEQVGNEDFPDLSKMERTGIVITTVPAPSDPTKDMPTSEQAAYQASLTRCQNKASKPFRFLDQGAARSLMLEWLNIYSATEASAAVLAANERGAACSRHTDFPASTFQGEIEVIEAKLPRLGADLAKQRAVQAAGIDALAKCFGHSIKLMDRLLTTRRTQFFAQNAQAIRAIEIETDASVSSLERRYGVKP